MVALDPCGSSRTRSAGNRTHHATLPPRRVLRGHARSPGRRADPVAGAGYYVANTDIRTDTCSDSVATASFLDGSYLAYDGWTLDHLSSGGLVLNRITTFPVFGFASFVTVSEDGTTPTSASRASASSTRWTSPRARPLR